MASTDSWTTGVPDVAITAIGNGVTFAAKTDSGGRFQIHLPAGRYQIAAALPGWSFEATPFSYENPGNLMLAAGGCAQVHLRGVESK